MCVCVPVCVCACVCVRVCVCVCVSACLSRVRAQGDYHVCCGPHLSRLCAGDGITFLEERWGADKLRCLGGSCQATENHSMWAQR